jgi:hypothetical protein
MRSFRISRFMPPNCKILLLMLLLVGISAQSVTGAPLASELFEYFGGPLNGKAGGTGFSGAWADVAGDLTSPLSIDSASLFYPGITSSGGSVKVPTFSTYTDSGRALAAPKSAGVFYFSALVQSVPDSGMYLGIGLGGNLANFGTNYTLYVTYDEPNQKTAFNISHEFDGQTSGYYETPGTGVFLIVGRLTIGAGSDTLAIWINPPFGASPPAVPNLSFTGYDIGSLTHLFIDGGTSLPVGNPHLDEFKLGTTYSDVVPAGSGNQPPSITTNATAMPSPVAGTSTALTVAASDDAPESELTYTWSYTGGSPVSFIENGTNAAKATNATFTTAGAYTFTVTVLDAGGLSTMSSVDVMVQQTATSIVVAPANVTIGKGDTQQFAASVRDQFNTALATQPSVSWGANGGGGIAADGTFSASAVGGPFTVTVTSGPLTGNASVTVTGETFAHWQTAHFTPAEIAAGIAAALADPEGDGLDNFLEYTVGTNPRTPTTLPAAARNATGHLTFTLTRPKSLPNVLYFGEATSALGSWPTAVPIEIVVDADPQTIRLTDPLGTGDSPQRYLHLRVAQSTP